MKLEIKFDEYKLSLLGQATKTGSGKVVEELFAEAATAGGNLHFFPYRAGEQVTYRLPDEYDQEVFDNLAVAKHLLGSKLVKTAIFRVENPAETTVKAILIGLNKFPINSRLWASWSSDMLTEHFPAPCGTWWPDSFNEFLSSFNEEEPFRYLSIGYYNAPGREAIFNPYIRPDCLVMSGYGLHPGCGEFVAAIGYPINKLSVIMGERL